jgi:hypothetical protein
MQHRFVVCYRRFGTTCWSYLQGSSSPRKVYVIVTFYENKSFIFALVGLQVFLGGAGERRQKGYLDARYSRLGIAV